MLINLLVQTLQDKKIGFTSFPSGPFTIVAIVNPLNKKLVNPTFVQCTETPILLQALNFTILATFICTNLSYGTIANRVQTSDKECFCLFLQVHRLAISFDQLDI